MSREVNSRRGPGSGVRGAIAEERVLAEVDRELRAALSISPSTDFEARVLRRVAEDAAPAGWSYGWLAAAALLVLAAGLFFVLTRTPAAVGDAPPQTADRQPDVRLAPPAHEGLPPAHKGPAYTGDTPARKGPAYASASAGRGFTPRQPASVGRGFTPRRVSEPEVIVPLNQMEAVRRLVRAVNEGRMVVVPEPPDGPVTPPNEIVVQPLVVDAIPVPALEPDGQAPTPGTERS